MLVALFNRNKDIQVYRQNLAEEKKKLDVFKEVRKYHFVSNLVGGKEKYEENLVLIHDLEIQLKYLDGTSRLGSYRRGNREGTAESCTGCTALIT